MKFDKKGEKLYEVACRVNNNKEFFYFICQIN